MGTITTKVLKDENGVKYAPITHIDAVLDKDSNALSEHLDQLDRLGEQLDERLDQIESNQTEDIPETLGVAYALKKANEMIKISQYIRASLPVPTDNQVAGETLVGLPYSSTRKTNTFVPNFVNYDTYLSALANPNSFAYTVNPNLGTLGALYYGVVCIMFVEYCLGIDVARHTNLSLFGVPGIEQVETQDAQAMRLGYIINRAQANTNPHCEICTGITRVNGVVTKIRLSESYQPVCREMEYTAEAFNALLSEYTILRYTKIEENTYTPFSQIKTESLVNRFVQTRKGDRSIWYTDEDVVLDVLSASTFTKYKVFKDGVLVSTESIPGNNVINLGNLAYGKYELLLTDDTNNSPSVSWIVADINVSASSAPGGIINVSFSSKNASAIGIYWCNDDYMARVVKEITEADRVAGMKATYLDSTTEWACKDVSGYAGDTEAELMALRFYDGADVYVRVLFLTEYGVITSQWPSPVSYKE